VACVGPLVKDALEDLGGDHRVEGLKPEILDKPFRRQNNVDVLAGLYINSDIFPRLTEPLNQRPHATIHKLTTKPLTPSCRQTPHRQQTSRI